jgi:hypothetical protein
LTLARRRVARPSDRLQKTQGFGVLPETASDKARLLRRLTFAESILSPRDTALGRTLFAQRIER